MTALRNIKPGRIHMPWRYMFYGVEGVGKSTLASDAPDPIWIDAEDGSGNLEVSRYPFRDEPGGHVPRTFDDILQAVDSLTTQDHAFKTLVIDTADRAESLLWQHMLERDSGKSTAMNPKGRKMMSIEDYGYGKGYQLALDVWRDLCRRLDELRAKRGMNIVMLAHAQVRTFKNPEGEDYDRYHLRVHDKAAGFLREWVDVMGFACFEEGASSMGDAKAKGYSTGRRLLKLERTAAYDGKTRLAVPKEIEMDIRSPWAPFGSAVEISQDEDRGDLGKLIEKELERIGDPELTKKVHGSMEGANSTTLARYLNGLKQKKEKNNV